MSRAPVLAAVAAIAAIALTSCSSAEGDGVYSGGGTGQAPVLSAPKGVYLSSNSTGQLGTTVIDAVGFTVYRSDSDSATPPTSNCDDACTKTWKPMVYEEPIVLEGVQKDDVGHFTRPDGVEQVTLGGWPAYTLVGEQTGSTTGHGKDGWFAVQPDGDKAAKAG
jgi:predicted lipoprotein with Yx(FWY)xxD motif